MARLYPPNIAGTLPSFYSTNGTTAELVVPFSMNASVSVSSVKGFYVRIKTTTTDTLINILDIDGWDTQTNQVTFILHETELKKMMTGSYYKIQIAYKDLQNICGHYSTAAIVKYTETPTINVQGLASGITNSVSTQTFVGQYQNADISEKVYQYRFLVKSVYTNPVGALIEEMLLDTDWLVHDSTNDMELTSSTDTVTISELLATGMNYTMLYSIITNNGLQINSPTYAIVATENYGEILPLALHADLDYENARMKVYASTLYPLPAGASINNIPAEDTNKYFFNGNYLLVRADSKTNFKSWVLVYTFYSQSPFEDWFYYDYTIESGVAYKYGLQRINANGVRSARKEMVNSVVSYFEDAYLYDGKRQLRIRYNANVSSIKNVIAESKKTTLGSKYPYILRNGYLNYKEFPLTGILSYLTDNDELFMTKDELVHEEIRLRRLVDEKQYSPSMKTIPFETTTDQTDENLTAERNFAMTALDWLNNGEIKLFKSSQEGNYIVKCTNVQLTPVNNTGRMLHNFTCTVSEVQDYSITALLKYNIIDLGDADSEGHIWVDRQAQPIFVPDVFRNTYMSVTPVEARREAFTNHDFTVINGQQVYVTKILIVDAIPGALFQYGENVFAIPQSGNYTIINERPLLLSLRKVYYVVGGNIYPSASFATPDEQTATIIISYKVDTSATFENVSSEKVKTYYGWSGYGLEESQGGAAQSRNLLKEFTGPKKTITKIYTVLPHSYPIYADKTYSYAVEHKNDLGRKFGGYLLIQDSSTGKYFVFDVDNDEWVELSTYNTNIREYNSSQSLINIKTTTADGQPLINSDNFLDKSKDYFTIGNSIFVNFYLQVQETTYALESTNPTLASMKPDVDNARRDYYMKVFNFEIVPQGTNDGTQLYVYEDERFSPISSVEWDPNVQYYKVKSGTYTKSEINLAASQYRRKMENYEATLQLYLNNQSGINNG